VEASGLVLWENPALASCRHRRHCRAPAAAVEEGTLPVWVAPGRVLFRLHLRCKVQGAREAERGSALWALPAPGLFLLRPRFKGLVVMVAEERSRVPWEDLARRWCRLRRPSEARVPAVAEVTGLAP